MWARIDFARRWSIAPVLMMVGTGTRYYPGYLPIKSAARAWSWGWKQSQLCLQPGIWIIHQEKLIWFSVCKDFHKELNVVSTLNSFHWGISSHLTPHPALHLHRGIYTCFWCREQRQLCSESSIWISQVVNQEKSEKLSTCQLSKIMTIWFLLNICFNKFDNGYALAGFFLQIVILDNFFCK